jgi:hypothetical protein
MKQSVRSDVRPGTSFTTRGTCAAGGVLMARAHRPREEAEVSVLQVDEVRLLRRRGSPPNRGTNSGATTTAPPGRRSALMAALLSGRKSSGGRSLPSSAASSPRSALTNGRGCTWPSLRSLPPPVVSHGASRWQVVHPQEFKASRTQQGPPTVAALLQLAERGRARRGFVASAQRRHRAGRFRRALSRQVQEQE